MKYDPYSKNHKVKVFDIETTGLYSSRDIIISAAFCKPEGGETEIIFTEKPSDEKETVSKILEILIECDTVLSYNGKSFDFPFLITRAEKYGLDADLSLLRSVDIYRLLKEYWPQAARPESLSQKSVEKALGIQSERNDGIQGSDCVLLYNDYLSTGNQETKETILLHNSDDVRQLARISEKLSFLPFHEIAFKEGFLVKKEELKALSSTCTLSGGRLSTKGTAAAQMLPVSAFDDHFRFDYDSFSGKFTMDVFTEERGDVVFVDLSRLPVDPEIFSSLGGFHSNFLELARSDTPLYAEAVRLSGALIENVLFPQDVSVISLK